MRYFRETGYAPHPRTMARAEAMATDNPDVLKVFRPSALHRVLQNENPVAIVNPSDFEGRLAFMFPEKYAQATDPGAVDPEVMKSLHDYIAELGSVAQDKGFADVPFLDVRSGFAPGEGAGMDLPALFVEGHEGRHRSRALERLGLPEMPVALYPKSYSEKQIPLERGETRQAQLRNLLEQRSPVFGEEPSAQPWAGGEDFPFLRWYRRGGHVNGRPYGEVT